MQTIFGIIVLVLDIWAIFSVLTSGSSVPAKLGWTLGILILPIVAFIVWYFAGPKGGGRLTA